MKQYIGVKMITAEPMARAEYNEYRGWELPADENGEDMGMLVEYEQDPQNTPNHPEHEGYISWSPLPVFESAYRETIGLPFGHAIEALKMGKRVTRPGWNGKKMFLFLLPAGRVPITAIHDPALRAVIQSELMGEPGKASEEVDHFDALGSIRMWTADKKVLTGWLASQTDMLAEDWMIL